MSGALPKKQPRQKTLHSYMKPGQEVLRCNSTLFIFDDGAGAAIVSKDTIIGYTDA
ncbi:MAG: 3-oxoacyl-[acyl-carrier-protein] synthase III [Neolewinella sp.]|jgi:3-oxoacyl-[acyl-carrier-protein] synthase III